MHYLYYTIRKLKGGSKRNEIAGFVDRLFTPMLVVHFFVETEILQCLLNYETTSTGDLKAK